MVTFMSETIITALISAMASMIVAFGTWHVSMRGDREKQTKEVLAKLEEHREEYLGGIGEVKDMVLEIQHKADLTDQKMDTLTERVNRHNHFMERLAEVEKETVVQTEQIKVANHRIDDLEHIASKL